MLDRSIRDKRNTLRITSTNLRRVAMDSDKTIIYTDLRNKQDDVYNKWQFYDNLIKNIERVENETNYRRVR